VIYAFAFICRFGTRAGNYSQSSVHGSRASLSVKIIASKEARVQLLSWNSFPLSKKKVTVSDSTAGYPDVRFFRRVRSNQTEVTVCCVCLLKLVIYVCIG
jgi:hypothetical protein